MDALDARVAYSDRPLKLREGARTRFGQFDYFDPVRCLWLQR